jgi:hypothetical protein
MVRAKEGKPRNPRPAMLKPKCLNCILTFLSYNPFIQFGKSVIKTDDNGKCFHLSRVLMVPNLQKNTKSWRKILMIKPGFEPRNIEMEVGHSMTYTTRTIGRNFLEKENNCSYKILIRFYFSNVRAAKCTFPVWFYGKLMVCSNEIMWKVQHFNFLWFLDRNILKLNDGRPCLGFLGHTYFFSVKIPYLFTFSDSLDQPWPTQIGSRAIF